MLKEKMPLLLKTFEYAEWKYPRKEMKTAMMIKDDLPPYLIDVLKKTLADPDECLLDGKKRV